MVRNAPSSGSNSPHGSLSTGSPIYGMYSSTSHDSIADPYIGIGNFGQDAKHVTVQRTIVFVQRWLSPSTGMETPLRARDVMSYSEIKLEFRTNPSGIGAFSPGIRSVG